MTKTEQKRVLIKKGYRINPFDFSWTKYKAACLIYYLYNKKEVDYLIYKNQKEIKIREKSERIRRERLEYLNRISGRT